MYKDRYAKEISFIAGIEAARKLEHSDSEQTEDDVAEYTQFVEIVKKRRPDLYDDFYPTMRVLYFPKLEFKPEYHPWYTLLTSTDINELKKAINNVFCSLLVGT